MAPAPPLPRPDRLDRLVTILDAATAEEGWHQPHRLVSLEPDPDGSGVTFGFRTLDPGVHPLDVLLGFRAPKTWSGLGVVCFGWAAPATDADTDLERHTAKRRPSAHPDRRRVRVVTLLDRRGRERATARLDDGTVVDEPGSGTVTDALRRCLDVPTAPPPVGSCELFAAQWLTSIADTPRSTLEWADVALLHPAMRLLDAGGHRPRPDELVGAGRALYGAITWEQLRLRAADSRADGLGVPADLAAWMDAGMFARWTLGGLPPLPLLLGRCCARVRPDVLFRIRHTLRAWNLDPPVVERAAG